MDHGTIKNTDTLKQDSSEKSILQSTSENSRHSTADDMPQSSSSSSQVSHPAATKGAYWGGQGSTKGGNAPAATKGRSLLWQQVKSYNEQRGFGGGKQKLDN